MLRIFFWMNHNPDEHLSQKCSVRPRSSTTLAYGRVWADYVRPSQASYYAASKTGFAATNSVRPAWRFFLWLSSVSDAAEHGNVWPLILTTEFSLCVIWTFCGVPLENAGSAHAQKKTQPDKSVRPSRAWNCLTSNLDQSNFSWIGLPVPRMRSLDPL